MSLKKPTDLFEQKAFLTEEYSVLDRPSTDEIPLRYSSENFVRYKSEANNNRKSLNQVEEMSIMINLLKEEVENKLGKDDLDTALYSYLTVLDENFQAIETSIKKCNKKDLSELRYNLSKLTTLVNEQFPKYTKQAKKNQIVVEEFEGKLKEIADVIDSNLEYFDQKLEKTNKDVRNVRADLTINEENFKRIDRYLTENHLDTVILKKEVLKEVKKLSTNNIREEVLRLEKKINAIRETYSQIDPDKVSHEIIEEVKALKGDLKEGLLNIPPGEKTSDPLTPLDQNFVTFDELQKHYSLFLNRVQQQLSTLGGGGETRLKYLDDIVGIATNASVYDGQYLSYDHSLGKFVFATPAADYSVDNWVDGLSGVYSFSNVGIGTSAQTQALEVVGNVYVTGIVTATDFDSLSDVNLKTNVNVISNPLEKVVQLRGVNFDWIEDNRPSMGVIAQEVAEVLPQLVHGYETKTVNYNGLIGLLIECVKKQQEEIEELKKRLP